VWVFVCWLGMRALRSPCVCVCEKVFWASSPWYHGAGPCPHLDARLTRSALPPPPPPPPTSPPCPCVTLPTVHVTPSQPYIYVRKDKRGREIESEVPLDERDPVFVQLRGLELRQVSERIEKEVSARDRKEKSSKPKVRGRATPPPPRLAGAPPPRAVLSLLCVLRCAGHVSGDACSVVLLAVRVSLAVGPGRRARPAEQVGQQRRAYQHQVQPARRHCP
jgi:hypothetical protein